ncbi:MAG: RNA-binding protein [Bacteroidetes bacterium]|nr:MAG: RNA-binding protein [Bacteroidota bacterium]
MIRHLFACAALVIFSLGCKEKKLFEKLSSDRTNIHFNNAISDNDTLNVINLENIYNGGGVGIGDFNNDGLQDIYFTGNNVPCKLYLNKGNFSFQDITDSAGVGGEGKWCRGVAVVDINNDGWPDIFVCATLLRDPEKRKNILYINQGKQADGIPRFKDMSAEYGFTGTSHTTMAAFFDYDNDGDLDLYLVTNELRKEDLASHFRPIIKDGSHFSTDHLYRNDWNDSLKHPVFTDVSKQAGILQEGYGHAVAITDINKDGWKDIYVSDDFLSNDLLWINNHDGTFTEQLGKYFKHTSANSMGNEVEDVNNDGLMDVIVLDMSPEDNYRKKMMANSSSYQTYQNSDFYGYEYQYVRNTLQINQGPTVGPNDSIGTPIFSDIAFYSGISETDWSWTPMVVDFDNDGYRDIIITNGFPKDVTDHDFMAFHQQAINVASKRFILDQIPEVRISNYAFRNNHNLKFTNETDAWGIRQEGFSNGAAYADFDNDGDLDYVVNNINGEAYVYKNTLNDNEKHPNYLQVKCEGDSPNVGGIGAWIELHYNHGKQQVYENTPFRGYLSTIQNMAHFGLDSISSVDSVIIKWPNGKSQLLQNVKANQLLVVKQSDAKDDYTFSHPAVATNSLFKEISDSLGLHVIQQEHDFLDFNIQRLIPHKLSEYGPGLAVADINGDGLDDVAMGGAFGYSTKFLIQQKDGRFQVRNLEKDTTSSKITEDMGILLFDADNDGDNDLYVSSGSYEFDSGSQNLRDKLLINDGKGNFVEDNSALPIILASKSCVRAADFDRDGDLDLFVAGRVQPSRYPKAVSSFIFRNDSKDGKIKFTDVTSSVAPSLVNLGLACDAIWTDFDNDGWTDLIIAGEWMPVTFLKNDHGTLKDVTAATGVQNQKGWWSSITAGDFDNDGDIDYVVGNLGENSFYRASDNEPVRIYAKDFDKNGSYDALLSVYIPDQHLNGGIRKEFPAQDRDLEIKQMIEMRRKFVSYKSYASATFDKLLSKEQLKDALILTANYFPTALLRNMGNGKFQLEAMPMQMQLSCIYGMVVDDFDGDGNLDIVVNGNDYGTEVTVGRYDAFNGLFLKGDGTGSFKPQTILQSGINIPGNGRALVSLRNPSGKCLLMASQNRGALKLFEAKDNATCASLAPNDMFATVKLKNGKTRKEEFYYGSSFLSQSGRFLRINDQAESVEVTDSKGAKRKLK